MIIADFTHNFFHEILDRNQSRYAAVFVDHNRHTDILLLHFAEQIAAQLAFRHEIDIAPHDRAQHADVRLAVGHLQHVLRIDDSLNVVNTSFIHRHARIVLRAQHFDEALNRSIRRNREHLRTRLHRLAHRLAAEFDHRLDQVAVTLLNDAFFLARFN